MILPGHCECRFWASVHLVLGVRKGLFIIFCIGCKGHTSFIIFWHPLSCSKNFSCVVCCFGGGGGRGSGLGRFLCNMVTSSLIAVNSVGVQGARGQSVFVFCNTWSMSWVAWYKMSLVERAGI